MRARALASLVVSTAVLLAPAIPSSAASPASSASTGLTSARTTEDPLTVAERAGLVADDRSRQVFVGDFRGDQVLVADWDGNLVGSVPQVPGVIDLALDADAGLVYASAFDSHEVVAIDVATLDVVARYPVDTGWGPHHLVVSGGRVWFSYGDQWDGDLGSLDPATGEVAMRQWSGRMYGQALLDTASARPGLVAVADTSLSTNSVGVVDVSDGTARTVAYHRGDYSLHDGIGEVDLVPGAPQVLVNGSVRDAWDEQGRMTRAGSYPSGSPADISASGLVAIAIRDTVKVFQPDSRTPMGVHAGGARLLAWSEDESRLFALTGENRMTLRVIDAPALATPVLTVAAPAAADRAEPLTVSGSLTSPVPFEAPTTVTVVRRDLETPDGTTLVPVTVAPDGTWSLTDAPPAGGEVTYEASYAGDEAHAPATATAVVAVRRDRPTLTLEPRTSTYAYGSEVTFVAHLDRTWRNRDLEIRADSTGGERPAKVVASGRVDRRGDLTWTTTLRRNTVVEAVYAGDARTEPRTVTRSTGVRVALRTTVSRHYRTAALGGQRYHWFRRGVAPVLTTRMTPHDDRMARLDLQVLSGGRWRPVTSDYFQLDPWGRVAVAIGAPPGTGVRARARMSYVRGEGRSGDDANATTYGPWFFLTWTR